MKLVIFDLDGTLIDSGRDIARSLNELLKERGEAPLAVERVLSFVGDGARKLVARALPGLSGEALDEAVSRYLEIYRDHLLDTTVAYPGVREALELLAPGRSLAVLTNKPRRESLRILEGLELTPYFRSVYGGDSFPRRKPDPIGVERLREEAGAEARETFFVGDTRVDFETARNASVPFCLVSYGLHPTRARHIEANLRVDDLRELAAFIEASASP